MEDAEGRFFREIARPTLLQRSYAQPVQSRSQASQSRRSGSGLRNFSGRGLRTADC